MLQFLECGCDDVHKHVGGGYLTHLHICMMHNAGNFSMSDLPLGHLVSIRGDTHGTTHTHSNAYKHASARTIAHKHIQAHTDTHKHTQEHTNTHKHTQTHTNTHKHTHNHSEKHIRAHEAVHAINIVLQCVAVRCKVLQ